MKKAFATLAATALLGAVCAGFAACNNGAGDGNGENKEPETPEVYVKLTKDEFAAAVEATLSAENLTVDIQSTEPVYALDYKIKYDLENNKLYMSDTAAGGSPEESYVWVENGTIKLMVKYLTESEERDLGKFSEENTLIDAYFAGIDMGKYPLASLPFADEYDSADFDESTGVYTFETIDEHGYGYDQTFEVTCADGKITRVTVIHEYSTTYTYGSYGTTSIVIPT